MQGMQLEREPTVNSSMSAETSPEMQAGAFASPDALLKDRTLHVSRFTFHFSYAILLVALFTLLAFVLRRFHLGSESLWFDEADIVGRARQPVSVLMQGFVQAGENGPLYTLLLHYWLALLDVVP